MTESHGARSKGINNDATIGFDADGRVLSVSGSAAEALGYTRPEDLTGLSLAALVGEEAAISLLDRVVAAEERESMAEATGIHFVPEIGESDTVTFVRQDSSRISLNTVITPETSGGWITFVDATAGRAESTGTVPVPQPVIDVASVLRTLALHNTDSVDDLCTRFASEMRDATSTDSVVIARSTGISGLYETLAHSTAHGTEAASGGLELPPSLVPRNGSASVRVESLDSLALFEPAVIAGEEISGAFIAARAELAAGAHLLIVITTTNNRSWSPQTVLLLEAAVLTLSGTLRAAGLDEMLASTSRSRETVRQIGLLASRDHNGEFLDAARKVIARRLPVSAISIHATDPVSSRCYVAAASNNGEQEHGPLAPGFEWQLAGSIEQRVLKTGAPIFISASSSDRIGVPTATIAHWRSSGLQAVAAIPLREAGEVMGVLLAGFSSAVGDSGEVISLLESISPAVHLGVGLSGGRPGSVPEPDDSTADSGFVSPKLLLALTIAAAESPDTPTLFASVTEWLLEIIPSARITWGTTDASANTYRHRHSYDTASDAITGEEAVQLEPDEFEALGIAGLGLPEPGRDLGHVSGEIRSMRAAVKADQRVLGVVTVWEREDEPFTTANLARLERACRFLSGPLERILETEATRESQRQLETTIQIGAQAAEFHEPVQALRSLGPMIATLLPHERALFIEIDPFTSVALVRYDSADSSNDQDAGAILLASLPSPEIARSPEPLALSLASSKAEWAPKQHSVFDNFASLLSIPVNAGEGPVCALLLLSEQPSVVSYKQMRLAAALSGQLIGAQTGWQAYRSIRESARDLRETRKQLNLLLDSAPVALISADTNGVCSRLEGHGLETLGIRREDMLGKSIFELTGKLPKLEEAIRQALRGIPATVTTSFGSHSAEVWVQPVTEIDGLVTGVTLIGYDVSERIRGRRAVSENRELQEKLVERSRTVSTVSHEMRNQLTSIIALADVLSAGAEKQLNEGQSHAVSVIQKTAGKLDKMIGDLLGLDYELDLSEVDVSNLMREIVDAQQPVFSLLGQTLSLNLPPAHFAINADHLRLTQVVLNLLSNASKYSPQDATVSIDVSVQEDDLKISVIDTGPGIPVAEIERVWDSGIRLKNSRTRTVQGSGLGLYIARKIVELHGGTATIESKIGVGTTVTVTLPGVRPADQPAVAEKPKTPARRRARELAPAASKLGGVKTKPKAARPAAGLQTRRHRRS